jgi:hypothetical protein
VLYKNNLYLYIYLLQQYVYVRPALHIYTHINKFIYKEVDGPPYIISPRASKISLLPSKEKLKALRLPGPGPRDGIELDSNRN